MSDIFVARIFTRCVRYLSGPVTPDGYNRLMRAGEY